MKRKLEGVVKDTKRLYGKAGVDPDVINSLKGALDVLRRHRKRLDDRRTPLKLAVSRLSIDLFAVAQAGEAFQRLAAKVGDRRALKLALTTAMNNITSMLDAFAGKEDK
jgi:hypothetical protein